MKDLMLQKVNLNQTLMEFPTKENATHSVSANFYCGKTRYKWSKYSASRETKPSQDNIIGFWHFLGITDWRARKCNLQITLRQFLFTEEMLSEIVNQTNEKTNWENLYNRMKERQI